MSHKPGTFITTYKGNSSNDLIVLSGELGSFLCTWTSFLFWTSLFLKTLIKSDDSAANLAVGDKTSNSHTEIICDTSCTGMHDGLIVSTVDSRSSGHKFKLWLGHRVVFLGEMFYYILVPISTQMCIRALANLMLEAAMDHHPNSRGRWNTPSHFILTKGNWDKLRPSGPLIKPQTLPSTNTRCIDRTR